MSPLCSLICLLAVIVLGASQNSSSTAPSNPAVNFAQRNFNTIQQIYNMTIHPNNQDFTANGLSAVPDGLFNENATGRITPIGNFSGIQDSVEYFFGLTPPPQAPLYDTWTSADIVSFTSGCPEVASSVVYGKTTGVNPNSSTFGQQVTTIKQIAFWRFDDSGAVLYYDAWIPNLSDYTALLYGTLPTPAFQTDVIGELCTSAQELCTGNDIQYNSTDACVSTLSAKPFGSWDEVWGDNVVCRTLHILLAKLRPAIHCPHVGPTGGGKCVNVQYNDVYFADDEALFGSLDTFMCPESTNSQPESSIQAPPAAPTPSAVSTPSATQLQSATQTNPTTHLSSDEPINSTESFPGQEPKGHKKGRHFGSNQLRGV